MFALIELTWPIWHIFSSRFLFTVNTTISKVLNNICHNKLDKFCINSIESRDGKEIIWSIGRCCVVIGMGFSQLGLLVRFSFVWHILYCNSNCCTCFEGCVAYREPRLDELVEKRNIFQTKVELFIIRTLLAGSGAITILYELYQSSGAMQKKLLKLNFHSPNRCLLFEIWK